MEVVTNRLLLRPFHMSDANAFFTMTRDIEIQQYVPFACSEFLIETKFDILTFYSKGDFVHDFYYIIENRKTHEMLGALIITQNIEKEFDMSLIIDKNHRRKGYMSEALLGFINSMQKNSVLSFVIKKTNIASLCTVQKIPNIFEANNNHFKDCRIFKYVV